jgi:hypothetical protein
VPKSLDDISRWAPSGHAASAIHAAKIETAFFIEAPRKFPKVRQRL